MSIRCLHLWFSVLRADGDRISPRREQTAGKQQFQREGYNKWLLPPREINLKSFRLCFNLKLLHLEATAAVFAMLLGVGTSNNTL